VSGVDWTESSTRDGGTPRAPLTCGPWSLSETSELVVAVSVAVQSKRLVWLQGYVSSTIRLVFGASRANNALNF